MVLLLVQEMAICLLMTTKHICNNNQPCSGQNVSGGV